MFSQVKEFSFACVCIEIPIGQHQNQVHPCPTPQLPQFLHSPSQWLCYRRVQLSAEELHGHVKKTKQQKQKTKVHHTFLIFRVTYSSSISINPRQ